MLYQTYINLCVNSRHEKTIPDYTIIANFMPDVKLFFMLDINAYLC